MMFLEACRAWKSSTGHATNGAAFTVLLEGEEESGSVSLPKFVKDHAAALKKCDVCLISDTGMLGRKAPAAFPHDIRAWLEARVSKRGAARKREAPS
jgi:acetylornithine deacetylase/succinyl-diaminopimelate desuccinylase-like protein